jgi:ribosome biogenesis GTPase / thiamine phosphate phosphatase
VPASTQAAVVDVVRVDFGGCLVRLPDGSLVRARARGKLMGPRKALGNVVVVGDRVVVESVPSGTGATSETAICEVRPRRNAFSRRASGRHGGEQVVAANLDQIVHVAAWDQPGFSPGLADRVLCQAEHAGIPARLVINKADLATSAQSAEGPAAILADYARAGYPGHAVSGRTGTGLPELLEACQGRRSLFVGHSGVGKSTLLTAMVPELELLAGQVNPKTGKGRHTTSAAWLLAPAPGLELVDTPGVRAFGLWGIGAADLDHAYPEFRPHLSGCRFADCSHAGEPGCAVGAAVADGGIAALRYASFLKLRRELIEDAAKETLRQEGWM